MQLSRSLLLKIALYAVGLIALCLLIALAGPLLSIGGRHPLDSDLLRYSLVFLVLAAGGGFGAYLLWRRAKRAEAIEAGLAGAEPQVASDEKVLTGKMKDALSTLKAAGGDKADYLYDLPWYIIIGPPGSGKTTALVNSGLKFPLSRGATPAAIAGSGGTRYCDWWFTEEAVLIDTAGRYTTQDSDKNADSRSWFAFLDLLKSNRAHQPINGVIVAISLEDVLTAKPEELQAHADAIRSRLIELHDRLKVDFPVYALFTKADLVAGFSEFFGSFNEQMRQQVWGATFKTADKTRNMIGEIPAEFDALLARLNDLTTDRLQEEPVPSTRVALFGFPAQMASLRKPVHDFLNRIFEPTRYHANAMLRGFYFTSGTQQGTPIDQLIDSLTKNFGGQQIKAAHFSQLGKSYFLNRLIGHTIIGEADWVSTDAAAVRRARLIQIAGYASLAAVCAVAVTLWSVSYARNRSLISAEDQATATFVAEAGPVIRQTRISDHDLKSVLPFLNKLRNLPAGFAERDVAVPTSETFGLSQRERLGTTATSSYRTGLERLLRPRLIFRLEEYLEQNRQNPSDIYEALKIYLMLTGAPKRDGQLVGAWLRQDWATLYPGAGDAAGRAALEQHLTAMLALEDGRDPLVGPNESLVREAQRSLARLSVAQRAYALLKSQADAAKATDWLPAQVCGGDFAELFQSARSEAGDAIRIPGFYTYAGFHRAFLPRLSGLQERLAGDRWVLGEAGEKSDVAAQYQNLPTDLQAIYTKDFIQTWADVLPRMKLKSMVADKPNYRALTIAAAANSPFKCLMEQVRLETALTRERDGFKSEDKSKKAGDKEAGVLVGSGTAQAAGAQIEAAFQPFHALVEGEATRRPIDAVVGGFAEVNQTLILATNPAEAPRANANLLVQVETMRRLATRLPAPLSAMLVGAAAEFDRDVTTGNLAQLRRLLGDQVTGICNQTIGSRYPFEKTNRDVALQDFGRLFGTGGVIDGFFNANLKPYVDLSKQNWTWRPETELGRALSAAPGTLRAFQQAARIREVYLAGGGAVPALTLSITPPQIVLPPSALPGLPAPASAFVVRMDVNGTPVTSTTGPPAPVVVQWPGANAGRSAVTVGDGGQSAVFERSGAWSLFRLIEAGSPLLSGSLVQVSYIVGGKELAYRFASNTSQNPFNLSLLREFQCPTGL